MGRQTGIQDGETRGLGMGERVTRGRTGGTLKTEKNGKGRVKERTERKM